MNTRFSFHSSVSIAKLLVLLSLFSGCLSKESADAIATSDTAVADLGFNGVTAVENVSGTVVKVNWNSATNTQTTKYKIYEVLGDGTLTAVGQVNVPGTFFYHTGLTPNTYHTYRVKAVDANGATDTNTVNKTAFTYAGVISAAATGTTSATVNFTSVGAGHSNARIYATARGTTTLVATALNTATSANVTGLNPGTTYSFTVKSVDFSSVEDSNTVTASAQTTTTWTTKYQGPMLVKAFGDSPNAPSGTPQTRQVSITWVAFVSSSSSTSYSLVRAAKGETIDTTTTTVCTSSLSTSCQVCSVTGSGAKTCTDTNVAASPAAYDYVVTLNNNSWPEEIPNTGSDSAYRITVQIPPDNMALVHRDSVNYEFCQNLGRTSDPLNHQRCAINGASMIGATPYNTGPGRTPLNLSTAYYDFGYNIFFDRWEAACNWTPQAEGGMCGASAVAGNCYGAADPVSTIGTDGNVYYRADVGSCWVKQSGAWVAVNSPSMTTANRVLAYTINPSSTYRKPVMVFLDQNRAWDTCQAIEDINYGKKRLPRQREWRAAAAWAYLSGEAGALTDTEIDTYERGNAGATTHTTLAYCNSTSHTGLTAAAFNTSELAGDTGDVVRSFVIGSNGTKNCVSRFGLQDMAGNVFEWASDYIIRDANTGTGTGTQSLLDTGNGYQLGFDMNGVNFDGTIAVGGLDLSRCSASTGLTATADPPGAGVGSVNNIALSTANTCYYKRDSTTWVPTASASMAEKVSMHAIANWTIQNATVGGTTSATGYASIYFNWALGMPLLTSNNSNTLNITTNSAKYHNDTVTILLSSSASTTLSNRVLSLGGSWGSGNGSGRWTSGWNSGPTLTGVGNGFRCVLPAE